MDKFIVPIVIALVLIMILLWVIGGYNRLVRLRNNVKEAFSTMDVYLKKRFDLIPNLVETVKGYSKHESETLEKVVSARSMIQNASTTEEKLAAENQLTSTLRTLFAVAESYPDLKANQNFIDLQDELSGMEDEIASSRKYYNGTVKMLNNAVEMFPSNILAGIFKFSAMPLFEVEDASERKNVKVSF